MNTADKTGCVVAKRSDGNASGGLDYVCIVGTPAIAELDAGIGA
jgi:hypothetical protein